MSFQTLTLQSIRARPIVLTLKRPVVARIATLADWPLILIDLHTEEGVIGRSYLEPYIPKSMRYLIPALRDLGEMLKGRRLAPIEFYEGARKSLHFVGYEGMAMIAVAGVDMAAWDALARAAGVPLCVLLGGSIGAVPAYNSNGLWLKSPAEVASEAVELREEGGFGGLKLRLGRKRLSDDLATVEAVREAVGSEISLMVDFNQGLHFGEALERCHAIDDLGLAWIEEPIVYDNLEGYARLTNESLRLRHARFHADRRRDGLATSSRHRRSGRHSDLHPSLSRAGGSRHAGQRNGALARVARLGEPDFAAAL
jgi:mandelate racemase